MINVSLESKTINFYNIILYTYKIITTNFNLKLKYFLYFHIKLH